MPSSPAGALRWFRATGGAVRTSPAIDRNGDIVVGSDDGKVYTFAARDGSVRVTFDLGTNPSQAPHHRR